MMAKIVTAVRKITGTTPKVAAPYTGTGLSNLRTMIDSGIGSARGLHAHTRVAMLRAIDAMIIRDPARLGKIIDAPTQSAIMDLVQYDQTRVRVTA